MWLCLKIGSSFVIKWRWGHTGLWQALDPMTSVFIRKNMREMWTKRHAREKAMWWWRHQWTGAATSLRRPKTASNYQRLGERYKRFFLTATRSNQPCWHPDFGLLGSRTVGEWFSVVFSHSNENKTGPPVCPAIIHRDTLCSSALGFDLKVFFNMESPEALCLCPLAPCRLLILHWQAQYSFHKGLRVPSF